MKLLILIASLAAIAALDAAGNRPIATFLGSLAAAARRAAP